MIRITPSEVRDPILIAMISEGGGIIKDDGCYTYLTRDDLHTHYRKCED